MDSMYERVGTPCKEDDLYTRLLFFANGGQTRRFHTIPTIKDINVGQHSFHVAWFCYLLGSLELNLIMAALSHDLAEQIWGDLPSPTKRTINYEDSLERGTLADNHAEFVLAPSQHFILNTADKMAGMLECIQERALGNTHAELCYKRFLRYLMADGTYRSPELQNSISQLIQSLEKLWQQANQQTTAK
jgi:5'-deoxynucleotidase YfbR-like HD superfamily hydrolase